MVLLHGYGRTHLDSYIEEKLVIDETIGNANVAKIHRSKGP